MPSACSQSLALGLSSLVLVQPMAEAGYPPFASSKYCRYHLPGDAPRTCVSESIYRWVFQLPSWVRLF